MIDDTIFNNILYVGESPALVKIDPHKRQFLVWWENCYGIHVYNEAGKEVYYWTVCGINPKPSQEAVSESMDRYISGDFNGEMV